MKVKGKNKGIKRYEKICVECNEGFIGNRSTGKYCGEVCRNKSARKRKNEELKSEIKKRYNL